MDIAAQNLAFSQELEQRLASFLEEKYSQLAAISPPAAELAAAIIELSSGGKRLRAQLAYWAWRGAGGAPQDPVITTAAAALELFHAAALIHDDIIDRSDMRRGTPSVHRRFTQLHTAQQWMQNPEHFGQSAGILAGDLCLAFSEELFSQLNAPSARRIFDTMRTEVIAGQYLDILAEVSTAGLDPDTALEQAQKVLTYKSARYSTTHPVALGAVLAGAQDSLLSQYAEFSTPLGEAFQLKDDILGVFGDPESTGKPAGDDIREGKRTTLVALSLKKTAAADRDFLLEHLGSAELSEEELQRVLGILRTSGSLAEVEATVQKLSEQSLASLDKLPIDPTAKLALQEITTRLMTRAT